MAGRRLAMGSCEVKLFIMSPDQKLREDLSSIPGVRVEGFSPEAPLSLSPPGGPSVSAWILDVQACQGRPPAVFQNLWEQSPVALVHRGDRPAGLVESAPCFAWPGDRARLKDWMDGLLPGGGDAEEGNEEGEPPAVVAVFGPRGGVGKTLVSTNLAAAAAMSGLRALLVDLDLHLPSVHAYLGMSPEGGLVPLLPYLDDPPEDVFDRNTPVHGPTGIRVMAGPSRPEMAEVVEPHHLRRLVELCRTRFRAVVLDLPAGISTDLLWECIGLVDQLVVVVRPDPHSISGLKAFLDLTGRLGLDLPTVRLVVNGGHAGAPLVREECGRYLGLRVAGDLPLDPRAVSESIACGRPVIMNGDPDGLPLALGCLARAVWYTDVPGVGRGRSRFHGVVQRLRRWVT